MTKTANLQRRMRVSGERAIREKFKKANLNGIEAMTAVWSQIYEEDGPRAFMELWLKTFPKEVNIDKDSRTIHVVGEAPKSAMAWAKRYGLPDAVTVDNTGLLIDENKEPVRYLEDGEETEVLPEADGKSFTRSAATK